MFIVQLKPVNNRDGSSHQHYTIVYYFESDGNTLSLQQAEEVGALPNSTETATNTLRALTLGLLVIVASCLMPNLYWVYLLMV